MITAWSGQLLAVVFWLCSHYQAPLTGTGLINSATGGDGQGVPLVLTQWWIQPGGAPASQSEISALSNQLRQAGACRFWPFPLIEGGWLLALACSSARLPSG